MAEIASLQANWSELPHELLQLDLKNKLSCIEDIILLHGLWLQIPLPLLQIITLCCLKLHDSLIFLPRKGTNSASSVMHMKEKTSSSTTIITTCSKGFANKLAPLELHMGGKEQTLADQRECNINNNNMLKGIVNKLFCVGTSYGWSLFSDDEIANFPVYDEFNFHRPKLLLDLDLLRRQF
ncbi:hypothetical protein FEM48_Zijuj07G0075400 [Ziziphus jujuba var. spinosa]|uniref:Uncharacterized protein n=1 Tax=Ziziphus jujuba var. spinosa TaxID=714518 RepID=A0A978V3B4_ZIZJJ|nr:hypothetical protein FEM48_Zijuj07G0075400 [Ziziphus jujuba var. spinosa]